VPEALKDGRFVILGSLGQGAQGHTFDGVDRREGRPVAIKRFDVRSAKSWKDAELAEREARVLQSLSHPKLPRYVDHFEQDGSLYLVMEKIEGESLAALRKRGAVLSEAAVLRLLRDASEVLEYLHGRAPPVIHRDLKPGNVLQRPDGSFAFVDFGAVRDKLRADGGSTVVGTFGFMAPEQFQGRALPASDVYAIGATALSMLTGRQPEELPHKGLAIDVRAALGGRAGGRLVDVLGAMLDPDPDRRPSRIAPLLSRLDDGNRSRNPSDRYDEHRTRHARRRTLRREEREKRWAERAARRRTHRHGFPGPLAWVFSLAFLMAMIAVSLATRVVVPIVLRILSLFFARNGLRAAASAVSEAGEAALRGMDRSRHWFFAQAWGGANDRGALEGAAAPEERVRVTNDAAAPKIRVEPSGHETAEEDDEASEAGSGSARR
jgi:tRNA A-37 threonylcarbamoyl transferase component Bud32